VLAACVLLLVACGPRVDASVAPAERSSPRLSPACWALDVLPSPERLVVGGKVRTLLTNVPEGEASAPRDLVLAFHGRTNDAKQVRRYFRLDEALPDAVIVYPHALLAGAGAFAWSAPGDQPERLRDFALVDAILDAFGRAHCIDLDRVFVVGHSLGASFANDVACHLGDRIRGAATVAGGLQGGPCVGRTAALVLHHPHDSLVPVMEGERVRDAFRAANGLAAAPAEPTVRPALARLQCVRYGPGDAAHPVVWCPHDDATAPGGRYYPHTWPDGAAMAIAAFISDLP
jgi:polyhydroxybutyrate depolymerase